MNMKTRDNQEFRAVINALGFDVNGYDEIKAGFSSDKKFKLTSEEGPFLLRISSKNQEGKRRTEFEIIQSAYEMGVKCAQPMKFGILDGFEVCFSCFRFIEGEDAETKLPLLPDTVAFSIGEEAGMDLRRLNDIKPKNGHETWSDRKRRKHEIYAREYINSGYSFKADREILDYIDSELSLMNETECVFQHDDFHVGNIIIHDNRYNGVIDFNRMDWGDYVHEFVKLGWFSRYVSEAFANGQIHGYFKNDIPEYFWKRYSLYMAMSLYSTIVWHMKYFPNLMDEMKKYLDMVLDDHEHFNRSKPKWKN